MFYKHLSKSISRKIIYIKTCTFLANSGIPKVLKTAKVHPQTWNRICSGEATEETAHKYLDAIIKRCFPDTTSEHIECINTRYAELYKGVNITRLGGAEKCKEKQKLKTLPI
ncbi:hypothetical protein FO497_13480 [Bacillus cereus ATCC 10876]|uniref:hypothetical protein n=1 Tax=Bacillus TaxID=1386 RepID=UPI000F7691A5|nr:MULTISPECIES: hypothetical protein [Bacillus]MBJ3788729.1 hypothetical protein [Bacillus sp. OA1]MDJ0280709.1 hypothetical protein [Bacillus bombysepticus]MDJ0300934.1 hypothetical protein [Bacillus bombysepticus]MDR4129861.1 hypothetical protein [Bacillus cereus ATCC 10876]MEC0113560.1 hypothetical protein [Bacillus cereus]